MRTWHHCRLTANRQCCRKHHCRLATNRQWWHCRLEPQTGSVGLAITAGSCHKPAVILTTTLPVETQTDSVVGTELYRVVLWTDSVGGNEHCRLCKESAVKLKNTAGLYEPTVIAYPHYCRYGCVGSKSDSDGVFWTGSIILIWGSAPGSSTCKKLKFDRAYLTYGS